MCNKSYSPLATVIQEQLGDQRRLKDYTVHFSHIGSSYNLIFNVHVNFHSETTGKDHYDIMNFSLLVTKNELIIHKYKSNIHVNTVEANWKDEIFRETTGKDQLIKDLKERLELTAEVVNIQYDDVAAIRPQRIVVREINIIGEQLSKSEIRFEGDLYHNQLSETS